MQLTERMAMQIAAAFVEEHNAAAVEYKAAFAKVGARMWHDDDAHKLKPYNETYIRNTLHGNAFFCTAKNILKIYNMTRPLTVLDSYPDVTLEQRQALDDEIDAIWAVYQGKWKARLKDILD